jgi:hypothetical protein
VFIPEKLKKIEKNGDFYKKNKNDTGIYAKNAGFLCKIP